MSIKLENNAVGKSSDVLIIAEISANHGQDFETAVSMIKSAKECGVDVPDHALLGSLVHFYRYAGRGGNPYGDDRPELGGVVGLGGDWTEVPALGDTEVLAADVERGHLDAGGVRIAPDVAEHTELDVGLVVQRRAGREVVVDLVLARRRGLDLVAESGLDGLSS